ncbi:hypothetical protein [Herbiconiux flava]|uniref:Integral membrane protein n=1 Tax=Herbiconiux flava TaxID=881268 RepID=A0A852SMX1_9MICO|nr:hypothetical protein [Herbiconiux flava]NYD70159.1 hypothetical protein [Herbiconiux flava]GLK16911.1 hypothetical protein GCM10017602_13930 [Herbiconiux flava]
MTATTHPLTVAGDAVTHPFWSSRGGAAITVGGSLLLAATVVEWLLVAQDAAGLVPLFAALFVAAAVAHAVAMVPVAFGRHGSDGAVGRSALGKAGLIVFGLAFLANQLAYLVVAYFLPAQDDYSAFLALQTALGVVQFVALLAGAIVIVRAGVATGAARWSLLVLAVLSIVLNGIGQLSGDVDVVTVVHLVSTVAQIIAGIVYLRHRR